MRQRWNIEPGTLFPGLVDGSKEVQVELPPVVSREEWLVARKALLEKEKESTRQRDLLNAARRRLPIVEVDKEYVFEGPAGRATLLDLFEGRRQLVVVSRAPLATITPFKRRMAWTFPWYSSFGSDFNYDFHVTLDESVAPVQYTYRDRETLARLGHTGRMSGARPPGGQHRGRRLPLPRRVLRR
jgi:predicted dithiol-disulfide oxidoreductase (DUF899 family)